jgi:O-antigen ligase
MCVVQWVLLVIGILWPVIAFGGGQGFSAVLTLAGLLCIPFVARRFKHHLYITGILLFLVFAMASAKWSPRPFELVSMNFETWQFALRFDVLKLGLILFWSGILILAAGTVEAGPARFIITCITWAMFVQLVLVAILTAFEPQALQLFSFAMPDPGEGIQNISRNGIIMALAAPFIVVGFGRQMSFSKALLVEILVFVAVVAVLAARGVNGPILSVGVGIAAVAVVRLFPSSGFKILGLGIATVIMTAPWLFGYLSAGADATMASDSAEWRLAIWKRVVEVINQDPVFGSGLGVLRTITETVPTGDFAGQLLIPNHAHNFALQIWAETGGIGAGLFSLAILLFAFRLPAPRYLSVAGFLGAALAGQFVSIGLVSFDFWNDWFWACAGILGALIIVMAKAEAIQDPSRLLPAPDKMPPVQSYQPRGY